MFRERAPRWQAHYQVQFACPLLADDGVTLNLSARGLCVITSRYISPGLQLYLRLLLPKQPAVDYQIAVVKWSHNRRIGLELSAIEEEDERRLSRLLLCLQANEQHDRVA